MDLLSEVRCQLDGCFFAFKKSRPEFCLVNKRGYYPFTPKPKDPPTESSKDLSDSERIISHKLEVDMKLANFCTLLPGLFSFICKRQARYSTQYFFVPEFARIVNEKKHEGRYEERAGFYELGHAACLYTEEIALELSKYM